MQGHSNCVGCLTALNVSRLPPVPATTSLQRYLKPIATLATTLTTEDGPCTLDKLVEENVVQQVQNLLVADIIAQDWKRRGPDGVVIHGWVYHLEDVSLHFFCLARLLSNTSDFAADWTGYYPRLEHFSRSTWPRPG